MRSDQLRPFAATTLGSLPHTDPVAAVALIRQYTPQIPAWPQLPRRDFREQIHAQFSRGFPGVRLEADRITVDRTVDMSAALEALYGRCLADDIGSMTPSADYAGGWAAFAGQRFDTAMAVKGQIIGPVSWGLTLTDQDRRAVLYDDVLADALARHLHLHAIGQERELSRMAPASIMFVDEPYLASFGSAYVSISRQQVLDLLGVVLDGLEGLTGIHCCGNTDWPLLMQAPIDILSFDAYSHAEHLALFAGDVQSFLERGGWLAWGVVPVGSDSEVFAQSADGLERRLDADMQRLISKGVSRDRLLSAAILTPACGLGTLSIEGATRALALLATLAERFQRCYGQPSSERQEAAA